MPKNHNPDAELPCAFNKIGLRTECPPGTVKTWKMNPDGTKGEYIGEAPPCYYWFDRFKKQEVE